LFPKTISKIPSLLISIVQMASRGELNFFGQYFNFKLPTTFINRITLSWIVTVFFIVLSTTSLANNSWKDFLA
jgi:hypothetical protein